MRTLITMQVEAEHQHTEVTSRLCAVEEQVKHTNGRVKKLETQQERAEAVEEYKKNNPPANVSVQTTNVTNIDWQKIILGLVGVLTVALTIVAAVVGVK
jgi:Mg-chelatase subunit ChlD